MEPVLQLQNASKSWKTWQGSCVCLKEVFLDVHAGESVAIVGPSGSGKSTLLHVLALLTPLDSGRILLGGREVAARSHGTDHRVRRSYGLIFQDGKLIPNLSVLENVCVPLLHQGMWPARQQRLACEMLERVGLAHRTHQRPNQLSGGELIRAAIARALVLRPQIVLADEPTGNLDSHTGTEIADLLLGITGENRSLVMVTHNEGLACRARRVVRIADGRCREVESNREAVP
jgi:putative ABC transport system ATP-binding protein